MIEMTMREWNQHPYRHKRKDGTRSVMRWDDEQGTVLDTVTIVSDIEPQTACTCPIIYGMRISHEDCDRHKHEW